MSLLFHITHASIVLFTVSLSVCIGMAFRMLILAERRLQERSWRKIKRQTTLVFWIVAGSAPIAAILSATCIVVSFVVNHHK